MPFGSDMSRQLAYCLVGAYSSGAMISVDETRLCSFQILKPVDKKPRYNFGEATLVKLGNLPTGVKVFQSPPLKWKICYAIFIHKDKMEEVLAS
ncbi:hypothetical protein SAY87_007156 [Trapa incisa]|uniref:Uncharacterized protein n=1 Tax=Trapa incisa TaxID=236973 RepID=A0AAN7K0J8_9MYRT|nr:hypothetical protein SAY87_007156 [Trapa incisa]